MASNYGLQPSDGLQPKMAGLRDAQELSEVYVEFRELTIISSAAENS